MNLFVGIQLFFLFTFRYIGLTRPYSLISTILEVHINNRMARLCLQLHLIDYMNVGELDPENDLWFFLSLAVGGKAAINCSGRGRSCSGLLRTAEVSIL